MTQESTQFSMYKSDEEMAEMEQVIPTKGVKSFKIVPHGIYGLFEIEWNEPGGKLPEKLSGRYTSTTQAEKAVKKYVENYQRPASPEALKADAEAERLARMSLGDTYKLKEIEEDGPTSKEDTKTPEEKEDNEKTSQEKEAVKSTGMFNTVFGKG